MDGVSAEERAAWTLGWYGDSYSSEESFSTYEQQQVARVSWLPIRSNIADTVLHLGVSLRDGSPRTASCACARVPGRSKRLTSSIRTSSTPSARTREGSKPITGRGRSCSAASTSCRTSTPTRPAIRRSTAARCSWLGTSPARRAPTSPQVRISWACRRRGPWARAGRVRSSWCCTTGRGPRCRHAARRPLQADYADGQLVPVGFHAPRVRVRLRRARSLRPDRDESLFQRPAPAHAVTVAPPRAGAPRRA